MYLWLVWLCICGGFNCCYYTEIYYRGLNFTNYMNTSWQPSSLAFDPNQYNELGKETVIHRILVNAEIQGLTQVYTDENVKIYKRST